MDGKRGEHSPAEAITRSVPEGPWGEVVVVLVAVAVHERWLQVVLLPTD